MPKNSYTSHRIRATIFDNLVRSHTRIVTGQRSDVAPRIGEVIEAASNSFVVQCYELYSAPSLGSFVLAGNPPVCGVVAQVRTQPLDPSRPILARGRDAATVEDLYRDNPQIHRLLTSRFEVLVVGHQSRETYRTGLPPQPPKVHSFVHACDPYEVVEFTSNLGFVHQLVHSGPCGTDDVIGACLHAAAEAHPSGSSFLLQAGRTLASELSGDLPRLNSILRRLSQ